MFQLRQFLFLIIPFPHFMHSFLFFYPYGILPQTVRYNSFAAFFYMPNFLNLALAHTLHQTRYSTLAFQHRCISGTCCSIAEVLPCSTGTFTARRPVRCSLSDSLYPVATPCLFSSPQLNFLAWDSYNFFALDI